MTVIGVVTASGSAGATTFSLALAAGVITSSQPENTSSRKLLRRNKAADPVVAEPVVAKKSVFVEASPFGGIVGQIYERNPELPNKGLHSFGTALGENSGVSWRDHSQELPGGTPWIGCISSLQQATTLLANVGYDVVSALANDPTVLAVIDFGRLYLGSPILSALSLSSITLVVCDSTAHGLVLASKVAKELVPDDVRLGWALVGNSRPIQEIEHHSDIPVHIELPLDPTGAGAILGQSASDKTITRSPYVRTVRTYADHLFSQHEHTQRQRTAPQNLVSPIQVSV